MQIRHTGMKCILVLFGAWYLVFLEADRGREKDVGSVAVQC